MARPSSDAPAARRLLLTGGGTAGHVNPLLAILQALPVPVEPLWVGSERAESRLVPEAGVPFREIDIRFSYRWPTPANWGYYRRHIFPLLRGTPFRQAESAVAEFQPSLLLASGGYVAAPVIRAALQAGVPVCLVQLDDPPGLVNTHFACQAWRILCSTQKVAEQLAALCTVGKLSVVGYPALPPRRSRDDLRAELGVEPGRKVLVVMGGSLGAGAIHRAVAQFVAATQTQADRIWQQLAVVHIAGERQELTAGIGINAAGAPLQYIPVGYVDGPSMLHASDFYFGRAGSATIGELVAAGIPALLMPDPQHRDRHQFGNAQHLVFHGQADVLDQREADHGARLAIWLRAVWDKPRLPSQSPTAAAAAARAIAEVWQ